MWLPRKFKVPDRGSGNPTPLGGPGMLAERRKAPAWKARGVSWPGVIRLRGQSVVGAVTLAVRRRGMDRWGIGLLQD